MADGHEHSLPSRFAVFSAKNGKPDIVARFENDDVRIAKNYLTENELNRLNLLVSQFLDFAEYKALAEEPMSMADWIAALDDQLMRLRTRLLVGKGSVGHDEAIAKAEREFEIYRAREMRKLKSDFDKAVRGYLPGLGGTGDE